MRGLWRAPKMSWIDSAPLPNMLWSCPVGDHARGASLVSGRGALRGLLTRSCAVLAAQRECRGGDPSDDRFERFSGNVRAESILARGERSGVYMDMSDGASVRGRRLRCPIHLLFLRRLVDAIIREASLFSGIRKKLS